MVLEDALQQDRYRDGDTAVVCPECGELVERFYTGVPEPLVRFHTECSECDVTLCRWAAVVMPASKTKAGNCPDAPFAEIVQSYWERQFRVGVESDSIPHTREFTEATQSLADEWGWDWQVECPLCDRSLPELSKAYLGYHHWEYETDIGTSLCEDCHDYLHGERNNHKANEQDWLAKTLGLRDFRALSVIKLAARDRAVHDVELAEDDSRYADRLRRRYNVPLSPSRISRLVGEIRYHNDISQLLDEETIDPSDGGNSSKAIPVREL